MIAESKEQPSTEVDNNKTYSLRYVLITPARNEEAFIEQTIKSVTAQTVLPIKWVIISDGSTDRTDEIVESYLKDYSWIKFIRMPEHRDRHFAAKVQCFNAGYNKIEEQDFQIIGNLDADISFGKDYFRFLVDKFKDDPKLGVAGTPFVENEKHYDYRFTNIEHVSGACQLFRCECFDEIGGYLPLKGGGIDWVAVTTARMKGWKTRTYTEKVCYHHRKMGTGNTSPIMTWFKQGSKDYALGNHPLWEFFRTLYQMTKKPYVIGSVLLITGFTWSAIVNTDKPISAELQDFVRREQMRRLKNVFRRFLRFKNKSATS